jgi:alkanesulfonate monooxygenase SsuD/methylene tetrahydromethanopterin reductase-like flavin-dependent oxidoreductase (luciferase family)
MVDSQQPEKNSATSRPGGAQVRGIAVNPPTQPGPSGLRDSPNKLKLGLFCTNVSGGMNLSAVPRCDEFGWDWSSRIARKADDLGFEFLIPVARWLGYGGDYDIHGGSFETLTWAAGLAPQTRQITLAATAHLAFMSPIFAAKAVATISHISKGRIALNAVMGWYPREAELWGIEMRAHDDRYAFGGEWVEAAKRLWTEDRPFDYDGKYLKLRHAESNPKPVGQPLLLNAGISNAGIDFCAKHCDFNFGQPPAGTEGENAHKVKARARDVYNRDVGSLNAVFIVCDDSEAEANRRYQAIIEHGDWPGSKNLMEAVGLHSESFPHKELQKLFIATGGGQPIVGTPEQVAEMLIKISNAGVDGLALGFVDYLEEMQYFTDRVCPLLRSAGLRK